MLKATFASSLLFISVLALAHGQRVPARQLVENALERYDDAPTLYWGTAVSPRKISQFGRFTSYQVNVDANGNNVVGDAANEPSITVDPVNPNRMSIGW